MFRSLMILLLLVLAWSVWQSVAETNLATEAAGFSAVSNRTPGTNTVAAPDKSNLVKEFASPEWIKSLAQDWPFLRYHYLGNELWKYIFSLIYIFLAFYVSKFLDYLTRVWLKKWASRTTSKLDDLLLELLNGPVKIVSFVIFLRIGLDVFDWPAQVQSILSKGFTVIVAVTVTYAVMKLVDLLMGYWHLRAAADADPQFREQIFPIIRKTFKAFVVVVATLVTLSNIGVNITAAIASLSIGGLAVGLAAQDTLANLFGAVAILLDKPFRIGDQIMLDNVTGAVETIGLRSTKIRNLDGHLVTIPNKTMGNATLTNITSRPNIKTVMNIGITYDTPTEKVKRALAILEEIYQGNPNTKDLLVSFNKFTDSTLNLQVVHWWNSTDMKAYLAGMQEINLAIKERFDAEGIGFAFPSQTLYLKQDSNWSIAQK
ncbi:MAG TPA: mechanosensitive ion channel family protein [Verrucomicrobiae bacterium]|nr:mechanosensitive ion channel family protein [Verrucomicrobiae bacterium]